MSGIAFCDVCLIKHNNKDEKMCKEMSDNHKKTIKRYKITTQNPIREVQSCSVAGHNERYFIF